jgi:hypothetical protein
VLSFYGGYKVERFKNGGICTFKMKTGKIPGFGDRENDSSSIYTQVYGHLLGKSRAVFGVHNNSLVGILKGFTQRHGVDYALFKPSIVYSADGKAHVNKRETQELKMPFDALRPIHPSDLEEWATAYNKAQKTKIKKD